MEVRKFRSSLVVSDYVTVLVNPEANHGVNNVVNPIQPNTPVPHHRSHERTYLGTGHKPDQNSAALQRHHLTRTVHREARHGAVEHPAVASRGLLIERADTV